MGSGLLRWTGRILAAAVIAGALAYIPYRVYGSDGYVHYRKLKAQRTQMEQQNSRGTADNARLGREIHRLKNDPAAIAAAARDDLGMVFPGEVVIQLDRAYLRGDAPADGKAEITP